MINDSRTQIKIVLVKSMSNDDNLNFNTGKASEMSVLKAKSINFRLFRPDQNGR